LKLIEAIADSVSYEMFFHFYRLLVDERPTLSFLLDTADQKLMFVLVSLETRLAFQ
jgi:hypothetical protein